PLIFYSSHLHFQQTNVTPGFLPEGIGGFFEFLKGRVVIPYLGSIEQFAHVIRHELVHVFMHSKLNRVLLDHRQTQDRGVPSWFTEGLAEFWSTEWDTQAEMVIRDAVINNYIIPVADMDRIYGSFLLYKEGQKVLEFIAERYGEETILLLMENFWKANTFSEVMRHTIGKDFKQLDEEWLYYLKKKYYPYIGTEDMPSGVTKNVVDVGFNHKPVFFKDGEKREVYFVGNHTGYTSIYRIDLNAEKASAEKVIEGETSDDFEAFHLFQSKMDISKDGMLAFITKSGENDALHLYNVKADELVETIRFRSLIVLTSPSWSPDGTRVVFSAVDKSGNNDLYILEIATRSLTRLTNDHYDDRDPAWSPDGNRIAFSSDRAPKGNEGIYNMFLYDLRTSGIQYLTTGEFRFHTPAWSPDGNWLAFTSDYGGAQNIWMMKTDEQSLAAPESGSIRSMRKVTNFTTAAFDPAWTDEGDMIFVAFENFSFQVKRIDNAHARYDSSAVQYAFFYDTAVEPWVPKKVEGPSVLGEYHYGGEYRLDVAQSQVSTDPIFGTSGGAALAMSDMLGNDQYYFLVYNTAQAQSEFLESFNVAISRISLGTRANHAYGIFHFAGNRYDLTDPDLFFYERAFGGYFALSYPLSKFKRVEASLTVSNSDKDILFGALPRKALLTSSSISFVWDNSLWGPSGPLDGNRMKLTLAYTTDVQYSNVDYYTVLADYRHYWRISTRSAIASRVNVWYNEGKEARRFFMGGSWDLRGWDRWSIRGEKIWLTSHELRFPFIDVLGIRFPFGGISFGSIRGAVFADFGGAWDDTYKDTKGSVGTGVRLNFAGALVLRYDIGKRIEKDMTQFQTGIFHQFFFGWDF
ncbi:MAG TPA: BamA/TamA family outer membrane protein, partial [Bacteroidota bacterium]